MVVSAKHVDAAVEPAATLVYVIGEVAGDVGRLAIALDDHAVAVIAKLARTQPGCTVSFEDVAKLAQSSNGLVYRTRLIERVFVKIDIEVNAKVVQGCSDFVEH